MLIRCKVLDSAGERQCPSQINIPDNQVTELTGYICRNHTRAEQVRANNRSYDPTRDEADKDIHFQDCAHDPELNGRVRPIEFPVYDEPDVDRD